MWIFDKTLLEIVLRSVFVYFFVLLGMRITGKREVGQMTPFDLVLLLLIANAVQNAMTGPDTSVSGGMIAAATLLTANFLVSWLTWRFGKFQRFMGGTPTPLIHQGQIIQINLNKERITLEDLDQALREHGIPNISEVAMAMLEIDGSISIIKKDEMPTVTHPHHHIRFLRKKS